MDSMRTEQKKCSFCGEEIPESQRRCPYCGSLHDNRVNNNREQFVSTDTVNKISNENSAAVPKHEFQVQPEISQQHQVRTQPAVNSLNAGGSDAGGPNYNTRAPYMANPAGKNMNPQMTGGRIMGNMSRHKPLGNGLKVFLTVLVSIVPGIGQLTGVIASIIFMNTEGDSDRKSFGISLLTASILMFALACIFGFVAAVAIPLV